MAEFPGFTIKFRDDCSCLDDDDTYEVLGINNVFINANTDEVFIKCCRGVFIIKTTKKSEETPYSLAD